MALRVAGVSSFVNIVWLCAIFCDTHALHLHGKTNSKYEIDDREVVKHKAYVLPNLGFPYDALEGIFVGSQTMHLHHDKHHAAYVATLNKALAEGEVEDAPADVAELLRHLSHVPGAIRSVVRNHGGGHMNHALFWKLLKPGGGRFPKGPLSERINADFGSLEAFQAVFEKGAASRFGSGWCWLVLEPGSGHLKICSTANQDNPVMDVDIGDCHGVPLLGLDVWEHAYYLDYFNARPAYVKAFWKVVNWHEVQTRFDEAMAKGLSEVQNSQAMACVSWASIPDRKSVV